MYTHSSGFSDHYQEKQTKTKQNKTKNLDDSVNLQQQTIAWANDAPDQV